MILGCAHYSGMVEQRENLIWIGRQFLEHAPPARQPAVAGLVGYKGELEVCVRCADRILGRGCNLRMLADVPVWEPDTVACDLCQGVST